MFGNPRSELRYPRGRGRRDDAHHYHPLPFRISGPHQAFSAGRVLGWRAAACDAPSVTALARVQATAGDHRCCAQRKSRRREDQRQDTR